MTFFLYFLLFLIAIKTSRTSRMNSKPAFASIEGNIGAGKTTLVEKLEEWVANNPRVRAILVKEPVDEWMEMENDDGMTLLAGLYRDPKGYAFPFQTTVFATVARKMSKAVREAHDVVISERSMESAYHVFTRMNYKNRNLTTLEYSILQILYEQLKRDLDAKVCEKKLIYLKTSPTVCLDRLKKRGREGEENISLEYLNNLHTQHEELLSTMEENQVLILDSDQDIFADPQVLDSWLQKIEDFLVLPQ